MEATAYLKVGLFSRVNFFESYNASIRLLHVYGFLYFTADQTLTMSLIIDFDAANFQCYTFSQRNE